MANVTVIGAQWGDEGKGKIVDYFAPNYDIIARFQGGPNAGHTLYVNGTKMVLHQIPSGIFHQDKINIIGNGVVLDPVTLKKECDAVAAMGVDVKKNLFISERTNIIIPSHRALDKASELSKGEAKIGCSHHQTLTGFTQREAHLSVWWLLSNVGLGPLFFSVSKYFL